jgi:uncharacterized membrane protein YebE (DUF533 family)
MAGGLLGLLLGGKKRGMFGGGLLSHGGAAVIGALALQAYQNYQRQQAGGRSQSLGGFDSAALPHTRPAADGSPFELALVRAMVAAAKSDGHIDATEQRRLFAEVERLGLDADAKAYVFDLLTHDIDVSSLARAVSSPEQGAELYLAARLAIDADEATERAFLDSLATELELPSQLRLDLDRAPTDLVADQTKPGA